jgi:hypothetical protein
MLSLSELCRSLDKTDGNEYIEMCVKEFKSNNQQTYAKEAYLKLGDMKGLLELYIDNGNWVIIININ